MALRAVTGRARPGRLVALAIGIVAVVLGLVPGLPPLVGLGVAGAHTDLLQGAPGPNQQVGGTVDFVDLVFAAPVADAVVELTDPNEAIVPGRMEVDQGQIIRYTMAALTEPGRYVLRYQMVSDDGDLTESGYFFTYDPGAFQPARLGQVEAPADGGIPVRRVALVVLVLSLLGMCLLLGVELRRRRATLAELRNR